VTRRLPFLAALALASCAHHRTPVAEAPPPAPVPVAYAPLPRYATPGMLIPAPSADGTYPTPNQGLSAAGTVWHLRAALNVAALSCPEPERSTITDAYNAMLVSRKKELAAAQTALAAEYRGQSGDFDSSMTSLYNFFAQLPARPGFCAAAASVMTSLSAVPANGLSDAAPEALAALDRPFTQFYAAYDAWRMHRALAPVAPVRTEFALSTPVPIAPAPGFRRIALDRVAVLGDARTLD
jgi:hypothetical protein